MKTRTFLAALVLLSDPAGAADLTALETEWIAAARPVLNYAQQQRLPIDIVVQPQDAPEAAPLAMGFVEGRCKLVLSMRGNPRAAAALDGVAPALVPALVEAMTAHEVGHCWRYVQGSWHALPAGFVEADAQAPHDQELIGRWRREMRATRREEGFADLVGLAWTLQKRPEQYAQVHAWFTAARDTAATLAGSHHDTRAWILLAADRAAFEGHDSLFEQARRLWRRGLSGDAD